MEHTPTPWRDDPKQGSAIGAAPVIVGITNRMGGLQVRPVCKVLYWLGSEDPEVTANAAFIVKACNEFEAMRDALKDLTAVVDGLTASARSGIAPEQNYFYACAEANLTASAILQRIEQRE
jgi:hypothetical protein